MKEYNFSMPSGAVRLLLVDRRPTSFFEGAGRVAYLFPSDSADFSVAYSGFQDSPLVEVLAVVSLYFSSVRGLPDSALSLELDGELYDIPYRGSRDAGLEIKIPAPRSLTQRRVVLSGIEETVYTVRSSRVARLIEAGGAYPKEMMRRLSVLDDEPTATSVISFAHTDESPVVTTLPEPTFMSLSPVIFILRQRGVKGRVTLIYLTSRFDYRISDGSVCAVIDPDFARPLFGS